LDGLFAIEKGECLPAASTSKGTYILYVRKGISTSESGAGVGFIKRRLIMMLVDKKKLEICG
jgi:hypothetical protein